MPLFHSVSLPFIDELLLHDLFHATCFCLLAEDLHFAPFFIWGTGIQIKDERIGPFVFLLVVLLNISFLLSFSFTMRTCNFNCGIGECTVPSNSFTFPPSMLLIQQNRLTNTLQKSNVDLLCLMGSTFFLVEWLMYIHMVACAFRGGCEFCGAQGRAAHIHGTPLWEKKY